MTDNQKLLVMLNQLRHILPEQRKGRIRHHDVRVLQQHDALFTAEIAIALQVMHADFFHRGHAVLIARAVIFQLDRALGLVLAEHVGLLVLVAGRDQFLQTQHFKIAGEVAEEVADAQTQAVPFCTLRPCV